MDVNVDKISDKDYTGKEESNGKNEIVDHIAPLEPIIVQSSSTDLIITNNLEKSITLNVSYHIYSNWFGKDSRVSKIFKVDANEQRYFRVYDNDGCKSAPCSVDVLHYEEIL